jgi:hypothetical protein
MKYFILLTLLFSCNQITDMQIQDYLTRKNEFTEYCTSVEKSCAVYSRVIIEEDFACRIESDGNSLRVTSIDSLVLIASFCNHARLSELEKTFKLFDCKGKK